jgi:hypothetical protein
VEKNFGLSAASLAEAFNVETGDPSAYQVKSLEELYADSAEEVGTASVRLFVALYLGLPFDLSTDIYLPETAAALLRERSLSGEQAAYMAAHTIPNLDGEPGTSVVEPTPQADPTQAISPDHSADSDERLVKGKTTFAELLEWGVSKEAIEQALGAPMPDSPGMKVKDYCTENGLSFETIKVALQAEVDQVK